MPASPSPASRIRAQVLDPGRDVHRQGPLARNAAAARARLTRFLDDLAAALAGHAGALDGEKALACADLAETLARRAGDGARPCLGPRAAASVAGHGSRDTNLRRLADESLGKKNLHVVFEIGAALLGAPSAAAAAAHELSEQIVEDFGHGGREVCAKTVARAVRTNALESCMAELVVSRPLLRVFQSLVRLVHFLEVDLGRTAPRIAVGVIFFCEPSKSAFDFVIGCALFQSEHFVVIALHCLFLGSSTIAASRRTISSSFSSIT